MASKPHSVSPALCNLSIYKFESFRHRSYNIFYGLIDHLYKREETIYEKHVLRGRIAFCLSQRIISTKCGQEEEAFAL